MIRGDGLVSIEDHLRVFIVDETHLDSQLIECKREG